MSKRIAIVGAVVENNESTVSLFMKVMYEYQNIWHSQTAITIDSENLIVYSLVVVGVLNQINALTGKLGNIPGVSVKSLITKKEVAC